MKAKGGKRTMALRAAFMAVCTLALAWLVLPVFFSDPMEELRVHTPAIVLYDAFDVPQGYRTTYDYEWRFPVSKEQVSPHFIDAILAIEDHDYYRHGGVSYRAIARAALSNIVGGRRISGASTIAMQLAALPQAGRRKTLWMKFLQCQKARRLAQLYSKDEILMEYINRIPCGGKIYGVQAAAMYYFDKPASRLSVEEAALIAGLPQRPNAFRPDRHPDRARSRQLMVLQAMERNGMLGRGEAAMRRLNYLPLNNFNEEPFYRRRSRHPMYFAMAVREARGCSELRTFLNTDYQELILRNLKSAVEELQGVKDAAAVLLDARNGRVLSLVGTLNFNDRIDGQVNAAVRRRSAGSTLKPFIYAEAIDGGLIAESTILKDAPIRYGAYMPTNYSGGFQGDVDAAEALAQSLNIPVIRLLSQLGVARVARRFIRMGMVDGSEHGVFATKGLTLALGTSGVSPLRLASAYTALANGGVMSCFSFTENGSARQARQFSQGTAAMVSMMLRRHPLDGATVDVAWKTGTSNGLFDAWCVAYTPEFVLAVWVGNKSGRPSSSLVGGRAAAPVAARIMSAIYARREPPEWPALETNMRRVKLCKASGMPPSAECNSYTYGWLLKEFSPRRCGRCGANAMPRIGILSPKPMVYVANDALGARLRLSADHPALWYVDGVYLENHDDGEGVLFAPGVHTVYAMSPDGSAESSSVTFTVSSASQIVLGR